MNHYTLPIHYNLSGFFFLYDFLLHQGCYFQKKNFGGKKKSKFSHYAKQTSRVHPSDAYPMQKVEKSIDRLGGANFITMLDLAPLDQPPLVTSIFCGKGMGPSLSKFYFSLPSSYTKRKGEISRQKNDYECY